jgi:hypothetical protein
MKNIAITGATGRIGRKISAKLIERGDNVSILSSNVKRAKEMVPDAAEYIEWNTASKEWFSALEQKDAVIHLAGENIMAKRWNEEHKKNIINSRVNTTRSLVAAVNRAQVKPKVFLSASAVGYYGNSESEVDESSIMGNDFLANVVAQWEKSSSDLISNVRRVNIRIGIVLDAKEGALAKMLPPFKYYVGGSLGSGSQWFPWIHNDDVVGIFLFMIDNLNANGTFNAVSPNPVRMKEFCTTLGKLINRPSIINVPEIVLRILLGEAADAILGGARVIPKRTMEIGYNFIYTDLKTALANLIK